MTGTRFLALSLGLVIGLLQGCSHWATATPEHGVLTGVVEAGSPCGRRPAPDRPGSQTCASRPVATAIQIIGLGDQSERSVRSDESGHFQIALPAGAYQLRVDGNGLYRSTQVNTVLTAGQPQTVRLRLISSAR